MTPPGASGRVERVAFASGGFAIDAALHRPAPPVRGAIAVAHPHPAHGGNRDHPVVVTVAARAARAGLFALRYDFRGVRLSEGDTRDAEGHVEDVRRALAEARARAPDGVLLGAGFSYGARMLARAVTDGAGARPPVQGLLLLAPAMRIPRSRRDFGNVLLGRPLPDAPLDPTATDALRRLPVRTRVLVGDGDPIAPTDLLTDALPPSAALEVLPGLNHFFSRGPGAGVTAEDVLGPAVDRALEALA